MPGRNNRAVWTCRRQRVTETRTHGRNLCSTALVACGLLVALASGVGCHDSSLTDRAPCRNGSAADPTVSGQSPTTDSPEHARPATASPTVALPTPVAADRSNTTPRNPVDFTAVAGPKPVEQWYERIEIGGATVGHNFVTRQIFPTSEKTPTSDGNTTDTKGHVKNADPAKNSGSAAAGDAVIHRWIGRTTMSLSRFGQTTTMRLVQISDETPAGRVLAFHVIVDQGDGPNTTSAERSGDTFQLTTRGPDGTIKPHSEQALSVPSDVGGFFAVERFLAEEPPANKPTRTMSLLVPLLNTVGTITLDGPDPGDTNTLRPVSSTLSVAGTDIASTYFVDQFGVVQRTEVPSAQQVSTRIPREEYLRLVKELGSPVPADFVATPQSSGRPLATAPTFDVGFDTMVPVTGETGTVRARATVTYRVTLDPGVTVAFPTTDAQAVTTNGEANVVVLTVRTLPVPVTRIDKKTSAPDSSFPPDLTAALGSGPMIQADDPTVVALLNAAMSQNSVKSTPTPSTPGQTALALTAFVHDYVEEKNFSRAFSSAAEVVASREGDCTEHAVLLAALLRAARIPARVAVGLVLLPDQSAMAYHMWTEAYLDGRWVGLDATLARSGVGADRITVLTSNLTEGGGYAALLPVLGLMGHTRVEIVPPATP